MDVAGMFSKGKKPTTAKRQASKQAGATAAKPTSPRTPQIRVAKNVYYKQILKKIARYLSYSVLVLVTIYMCFAITILRVIPTSTNMGFVPVKNATFSGGIAPKGSTLVVNTREAQGDGTVDRLKQAFLMTNDGALVEVVAGPYGKLTWAETGLVTVDGNPMPVTLHNDPKKEFLDNEYLVKCVEGACKKGEGLLIPTSNIYGEPLGRGGK